MQNLVRLTLTICVATGATNTSCSDRVAADDDPPRLQVVVSLDNQPVERAAVSLKRSVKDDVGLKTTTNAQGHSQFSEDTPLEVGSYLLRVELPRTGPSQPIRAIARPIRIKAGENSVKVDFPAGKPMGVAQREPIGDAQRKELLEAALKRIRIARLPPEVALLQRHLAVRRSLVRRLCQLSEDQIVQLEQLDESWLAELVVQKRQAAPKLAEARQPTTEAIRQLIARARQPDAAVALWQSGVDQAITQILTVEQRRTIAEADRERQDFYARALADGVLAALDRELYLTAAQRQAMFPEILSWTSDKQLFWGYYFMATSHLPDLPQSIVQRHLNEEQLAVYEGLERRNIDWFERARQMAQMWGAREREGLIIEP